MEWERSIGLLLERDRLEHRVQRMELVISNLRDRAVLHHATMGTEPPSLRQSIASFELEVSATRRRLSELGHIDSTSRPPAGD